MKLRIEGYSQKKMAEGNLNDHNAEAHRRMIEVEKLIAAFEMCSAGGYSKETIRQNVEYLRKVIELKKVEAVAHIDKELFQLRDELVRKVDFACKQKQDKLSDVDWKVQLNRQTAEALKIFHANRLRSLLTLEVRRVEGFRCESFAYIRACDAVPQRMSFIENYEMHKYRVGSNVIMYYMCQMGYVPELIHYSKASANHEAGDEEVAISNIDLLNGVYQLEFVAGREGAYDVQVTLFGQHINGSPLKITVQGAVAHKGRHKLESAHTERQDLSMVAGVTAAAEVMNIGSAHVSNATGQEKLEPVVTKELQMPLDAAKGHCKELVTTHANDLPSEIQQPFVQSLLSSAIEPSLSDPSGKSSEPPPNDVLSKFFSHIELPRRQTAVTKHDALSSQNSALSGSSLGSASYSSLRSSKPLQSVDDVAKSENTFFTGSSQPVGKPVSKPGTAAPLTDGGKSMGDPLKPTYVVTTVAPDSSTKRSTACSKVSPSTHKKEPVGFSGTITAKLTLEFDTYRSSKFAFPIGVTATPSGNIIIADTSQDRVLTFDPEGRALHKAIFSGSSDSFRRPSAVVALHDESYAVKDDRCIYVFSKNGEFIRSLGKHSLCKPYGLAAQGENLFTISLGDAVPTLRCFSASGNFEQCVAYGPLLPSTPAGSKCRFMDVHNGHIFVSDLGLSCMYKTDMKGVLVSTFGIKGKDCGQMIEPSGVSATDRCVFIGDSKNNRVQAFDANGNFITVVKMASGIIRPSGVHVSEKDKLYVLNYLHGVVGVYKLNFNEVTP